MIVSVQLRNISLKGSNVLDTNTIISSNFENVTYQQMSIFFKKKKKACVLYVQLSLNLHLSCQWLV